MPVFLLQTFSWLHHDVVLQNMEEKWIKVVLLDQFYLLCETFTYGTLKAFLLHETTSHSYSKCEFSFISVLPTRH